MNRTRLTAFWLSAVLLLTGCAAPADDVATDGVPTEDASQIVSLSPDDASAQRCAMPISPDGGWDPYTCRDQTNRTLFPLLYEGLFEITPEFEARGVLCMRSRVSDDEKTWTFTLASASFSDGSALTASDVVTALGAAKSSALYAGRFDHITAITAQGTRTVIVTTDTAMGDLPLLLDIPIVRIDGSALLGTGPYVRDGQTLRVNANWWQKTAAPLGGADIALVALDSADAVRDAFELREVTLVHTDPTAGTACVYHSDFELWTVPGSVMVYLGFNRQSTLFSSSATRAAVTHLIDRETIAIDDFGGFASAASLPASPQSTRYDRGLAAQYAYDPARFDAEIPAAAGTLLVNAGDRCRVAAAERIADTLREAGFDLQVSALPSEAFQKALSTGAYDCYLGEIRLTADFNLESFLRPDGAAAYGIGGSEVALLRNTKMLENAGNAYDLYKQVMDDGLFCPILFKRTALYAARAIAPTGFTAAPYNIFFSS